MSESLTDEVMASMKMPPKKREIIPPEGGWKPQTVYEVEVSMTSTNPIHRSFLWSAFLNPEGGLPGHATVWCPTGEDLNEVHHYHYIKAIRTL